MRQDIPHFALSFLGSDALSNACNLHIEYHEVSNTEVWVSFLELSLPSALSHKALRASPLVLTMWACTLKSDEEKWKHAGLAQEIGFCCCKCAHQFAEVSKRCSFAAHLLDKSVTNVIRLLLPPYTWFRPNRMITQGSFAISSSSHLFAVLGSVLCVGLQKKKK
jgi:hypothetical protein